MWKKPFLHHFPTKGWTIFLSTAWEAPPRENILTVKKILYSENRKIAQHSQDFLMASAATKSHAENDPSSHYAFSERLLASLGALGYQNPGRGVSLQQGLQGEQVTGLVW